MVWFSSNTRVLHARMVAFIVVLVEVCRLSFLLTLPDSRLAQYVPDDAFYYLQAARNFARMGRWTFDGVAPSSGFHLLWGYLLALGFKIHPAATLHQIFFWGGLLQLLCLAVGAFLVARTAERFGGACASGGVLLVFLSATSLMQATWLMESCFVISTAAATLFLLARTDLPSTSGNLVAAFTIGLLASLSRSDAGLLAFLFLWAHLLLWFFDKGTRSMLLLSAVLLGGAACGVALVTLHSHWISGQWFQASALEKVYWTKILGAAPGRPVHIVYNLFDPLYNVAAESTIARSLLERRLHAVHHLFPPSALLTICVVLCLAYGLWKRLSTLATGPRVLLLAPLATILAFFFTDRLVSAAVQGWYVSNFEAPVAMLAGVGLAPFFDRHLRPAAVLLVSFCLAGVACSFVAPAPWQEAMWRAGVQLGQHPTSHPAGAWNAGILGFASDRGVVNLDGLMNDHILPYTRNGTLKTYLAQRNIETIIDSPHMWDISLASIGGYANGELERCIVTRQDLFPGDLDNNWNNVGLHWYTLDPYCLAHPSHNP